MFSLTYKVIIECDGVKHLCFDDSFVKLCTTTYLCCLLVDLISHPKKKRLIWHSRSLQCFQY